MPTLREYAGETGTPRRRRWAEVYEDVRGAAMNPDKNLLKRVRSEGIMCAGVLPTDTLCPVPRVHV